MEDHIFAADTLVEEREVVMHPPSGNPALRNAHFLKPIFSEDHTHLPTPPSPILCSKPTSENPKNYSLRSYKNYPTEKWKIWVHSLKPKYQEIWKQAGIYEAILTSTYKIRKHKELILGLAERWCAETNTFIFPWGEVTITLEDVMFLGGYSVLGALYLTPLAGECVDIFDCLKKAHHEIKVRGHVSSPMWMEYFMCSGKQLEHEAFLAMWLSRFVLLRCRSDIIISDFHVAIHLSRGDRIALAPVVLASIYTDLRLLHNSIVESVYLESIVHLNFLLCHSDLVHMWACERFPELRPTPSVMERSEPRSTRWNGVKILEVSNVRAALDSGKESFVWRPYVMTLSSCMLSKLYGDNEQWVVVESGEVESFARCLRVSELVGLDYIEQYLPHRVAMQFGLDQDVPPHVIRSNESLKTAWSSYNRSFKGTKIYIPPRLFESDVSSRYVVWWRGLLPVNEEMVTTCIQNEKHLSSTERSINLREDLKEDAVVGDANHAHAEVNNVNIELAKDEVMSKANCPENDFVNIEEESDTLVEEREVVMYPHGGGNPTLRNAHFIKPICSEHHNHLPSPPTLLFSSKSTTENLKNYNLQSYKRSPPEKWKIWVHSLKPKYQEIWKQAGIYEAILASTYKIQKHKELILGLAERWCAETNTFIFPWGEVTITLEDVMFLGGYSVLGALFLTPIADECAGIYESLRQAYKEVKIPGGDVTAPMWMEYFMFSGNQFEHEAFLAMWLSTFVLIRSKCKIIMKDFHVAIHLSRGNRIALAPVVLASIYKDMKLLHNSIVESIKLESKDCLRFNLCHADLVHMWVWERFPKLRPTQNVMERTEPRSARWNGVKILKVRDVRAILDSGKESFIWRPYVITSSICMLSKLYRDNEQWVMVESDDIESFARCLRVSEIVGLDNIEQYLPHRVAMQFGLDQDVPPRVMRSNECPKTAWRSYNRSFKGTKIYIPPRLFESDVSSRYVVWWRGLLPVNEEMVATCIQNEKHLPLISWGHKRRRSRKTLSRKSKSFGKRNNLDDMLVLKTHSWTETPARRFGMTEPVISSVRSISSADKTEERKSSAERSINLKEDAVVNNANHAKANNVNIKLAKDEVMSKAYSCHDYARECDDQDSEESILSSQLILLLHRTSLCMLLQFCFSYFSSMDGSPKYRVKIYDLNDIIMG